MEALARWWQRKYKLPSNHELFLERTEFDLMVEFYEDMFDEKPLEAMRNEDGHIQFTDTGDPLIDKWEAEIAQGMDPNLWDAFSPEMQERLMKRRKPGGYGTDEMFDPRKRAIPGLSMGEVSANIARQNAAELSAVEGQQSYMRAFQKARK